MKAYYVFPKEGSPLTVEQEPSELITIQVSGEFLPRFEKKELVHQLQKLIEHIEKYG